MLQAVKYAQVIARYAHYHFKNINPVSAYDLQKFLLKKSSCLVDALRLTGVERFYSCVNNLGPARLPNYECDATEQTAGHIVTTCPIHWASNGGQGLTDLNDEAQCWLNNFTANV